MRNMHLTEGDCKQLVKRTVLVRVLGPLEEAVEGGVLKLQVDGNTSLLELFNKFPEKLKNTVLVGREIAPDLLVVVDGVELSCLGPPEEVLIGEAGVKEIVLVPVIHGG